MSESFRAGPPSLLRAINERAVLEFVSESGAATRAAIADQLALSKPTVAAALTHLVERGAVSSQGQVSGKKGPAAVLYEVAPDAYLALGIDIGAKWIRVALRDAAGVVRGESSEPTPPTLGQVAPLAKRMGQQLAADAGFVLADITAVVVALPGVIRADGRTLDFADGLPGGGARLGHALAVEFGEEVVLENDLNVGALAEHSTGGAAADVDDFVLLGLGTGVGMGVMLGGRLHRGGRGLVGEVGYLPSHSHENPDTRRVDDVLGAGPITRLARDAGLGALSAQEVFDLGREGDARALEVIDDAAKGLAWVISCVVPALDPSLIVLGGSIGSNGDLLLGPVRAHLGTFSLLTPDVAISTLGSRATLLGALDRATAIARDRAFTAVTAPE